MQLSRLLLKRGSTTGKAEEMPQKRTKAYLQKSELSHEWLNCSNNMETRDQHTAERKMKVKSESVNHSVVSDSLRPHGQTPWSLKFPSKHTGVGSHSLLQGISWTQGSNPGLLHCRQILDCLNHQGSPVRNILRSFRGKHVGQWSLNLQLSLTFMN